MRYDLQIAIQLGTGQNLQVARPLRIAVRDGFYHVMSRGIEHRAIFCDDRDRTVFLDKLGQLPERFGVLVHAYTLMPNHYHLLLQTPRANLSPATQWLNVSHSVRFNHRRGRVGPLFAGRFKAKPVDADAYALEVSRYVHLNAVRTRVHGLEKTAHTSRRLGIGQAPTVTQVNGRLRALRAYRWSSYRVYLGLAKGDDWLTVRHVLALAGGRSTKERRRNYQTFVEHAVREGIPEDDWQRLERAVVIGSGAFVQRMRSLVRGERLDHPELRWFTPRADFRAVKQAVERVKGEPWESFVDRRGDWGRDLALWLARRKGGATLKELAREARLTNYRGMTTVISNFEKRLQADKHMQRAAAHAVRLMTYET